MRRIEPGRRGERIRAMTDLCGLGDVIHRPFRELSRGYKQRVGLAHAMLSDPDILILDEPTSGLDPNQIVEIRSIIKEAGREKTVIFSTHILSEVETTCDRIVIINRGRVAADGTADVVKARALSGLAVRLALLDAKLDDVQRHLLAVPGVNSVVRVLDAPLPVAGALLVEVSCGSQNLRELYAAIKARDWVVVGPQLRGPLAGGHVPGADRRGRRQRRSGSGRGRRGGGGERMSGAFFRVVWRELRAAFGSPVAYIVTVIFLTVTGWFFFTPFFLNGRADLREFFRLLPMTLGLVVPAVTMRVFAEEFSTGSYEVLTTLPMTRFDVLLGKFTGSLLFILLMLVPTLAYPIIVATLGDLDPGPVVGGYLGTILLAALYCSVGLFASALTKNQIVAFIIGLALCAFLVLIDKVLFFIPAGLTGVLQYLGADYHFGNVAKGVIDSRDVVYFLSATFVGLYATNLVVERRI